jgi:hypothetical protein
VVRRNHILAEPHLSSRGRQVTAVFGCGPVIAFQPSGVLPCFR